MDLPGGEKGTAPRLPKPRPPRLPNPPKPRTRAESPGKDCKMTNTTNTTNTTNQTTSTDSIDATRALAQEAFTEAIMKLQHEGINEDTDLCGLIRNALIAGGFDFNSREAIDGFFSIAEEEFEGIKKREAELVNEFKAVLIEAGATELQLEWGNTSQAKPNWRQRRKLEKIGNALDALQFEALVPMTVAAVLNEARAALG